MIEIIVTILVLIILAYIDTYIGKSKNNTAYKPTLNDDIEHEPIERTEEPCDVEQPVNNIPAWKLYTGKLALIPAELKKAYLDSVEWKTLKELRLEIAGHKCEKCGSKHWLHLHHVSYIRLTQESIDDVCILCSKCHKKIHDKLGKDRNTEYPID